MAIDRSYRRPSIRSCLLGIVVGLLVYLIFWYVVFAFPYIADFLAVPFLFIPEQLGLVERVTKEDVITITVPPEHEFELSKAGDYFIFSTNLLPAEDRALVKSKGTNERIPVSYILDGVNQYGTSVVEGRPIFEFEAKRAGAYELYLQKLPYNVKPQYTLFIVSDVTSRNRAVLIISFVLHTSIIVLAGRQIYYWRNKDRVHREKMAKDEKHTSFEEWIKSERANRGGEI